MKASTQFLAIPFTDKLLIQNPKGIDFNNIIIQLDSKYMKSLSITYQNQKFFFADLFKLPETHERRTEQLLAHNYDTRIAKRKVDQSMCNTKLVNLLEGSLHSIKDYLSVIPS